MFFEPVSGLCCMLTGFRLYWVLDFMNETANDLLENYKTILTEREVLVCKRLADKKFIKRIKAVNDIPLLQRKIAMLLYEVFKICRKLNIEDKQIVIENFNLNRIQ